MGTTVIGIFRHRTAAVVRTSFANKLLIPRNEALLEDEGEDDENGADRAESDENCSLAPLPAVATGSTLFANLGAGHALTVFRTTGSYSVSRLCHEITILFHTLGCSGSGWEC